MLAGISVEYYTRLERGTTTGASEEVLEGISRALQLDAAERAHLFDLARAADPPDPPVAGPPPNEQVRRSSQMLDALVRSPRTCATAASTSSLNPLGAALYSPVLDSPSAGGFGRAAQQRPLPVSQTLGPPSSSGTGTPSPTTPWPSCTPRPAATPTTSA